MRTLVWLLCAVTLAGCSTVSGWFGSKVEPLPPPPEIARGLGVEVVWSAKIGDSGNRRFSPALDGTFAYVAEEDGTVRALALDNGREVWSQRLKGRISSGVATGEGLVLVGSAEGELIALNAADGVERWRSQLGGELLSPARALPGWVVAQTSDDAIHGLDATDGKRRWRAAFTGPLLSLYGTATPWADESQVVTGLANGKLVALQLDSGRTRWETPVARPTGRSEVERLVDIDAAFQVRDGVAYAVSYHAGLAAVALAEGGIIWQRELASQAGLSLAGQHLYLSTREGRVFALDNRNGVALWQQEKLQKRKPGVPIRVGAHIVVADNEGQIYWLNATDGELVARHNFDGKDSRPVLLAVGDRVLVQSASGRCALLAVPP